jgi:geranylgeranyl diphosphate synthase type II
MDAVSRIENALNAAFSRAEEPACPPRLAAAMRSAVFPRGARIRPRICLAVAAACGEDDPAVAEAAAVSIELLHCASLVHDDLPCFDDADTRRGRPTVHFAYGEPLAVLAGDGLIVLAFQSLARVAHQPKRLAGLLNIVGHAVGAPSGIVAGQAWECEPQVDLAHYHRSKTAALFVASTEAGAASTGAESRPWRLLGERLGEAYQVADDIRDAVGTTDELGKPIGRDAVLGRPSATQQFGIHGSIQRLELLVHEGMESIPDCPGAEDLRALIMLEATRLLPKGLARQAA